MTDKQTKIYIYNAPDDVPKDIGPSIFLAGHTADDWRTRIIDQLEKLIERPIAIFNPLRTDWNSTWTERSSNAQFHKQVQWELDAQKRADVVAVYLHPRTLSPTTLLELGLAIQRRRAVVCCPDGFYLKGHVEMVCDQYDIPLVETFEDLVRHMIEKLSRT